MGAGASRQVSAIGTADFTKEAALKQFFDSAPARSVPPPPAAFKALACNNKQSFIALFQECCKRVARMDLAIPSGVELDRATWLLRVFTLQSGLAIFDISLIDVWNHVDVVILWHAAAICAEEGKPLKGVRIGGVEVARQRPKRVEQSAQTDPPVRGEKGVQVPEPGETTGGRRSRRDRTEAVVERPVPKLQAKPVVKPQPKRRDADGYYYASAYSDDDPLPPKRDASKPPTDGPTLFTDAVTQLTKVLNYISIPGPDSVVTPFRLDVLHAMLGAASLSFYFLNISAHRAIPAGMRYLRTDSLLLFIVRTAAACKDPALLKNAVALALRLFAYPGFRQAFVSMPLESFDSCRGLLRGGDFREEALAMLYQVAATRPDFTKQKGTSHLFSNVLHVALSAAPAEGQISQVVRFAVALMDAMLCSGGFELRDESLVQAVLGFGRDDAVLQPLCALIIRRIAGGVSPDSAGLVIAALGAWKGTAQVTLLETIVDGVNEGGGFVVGLVAGLALVKAAKVPRGAEALQAATIAWGRSALGRMRRSADGGLSRGGVGRDPKIEGQTSPVPKHDWELVKSLHVDWANALFYRCFHAEVDAMAVL